MKSKQQKRNEAADRIQMEIAKILAKPEEKQNTGRLYRLKAEYSSLILHRGV
jgi:hypothetical protein